MTESLKGSLETILVVCGDEALVEMVVAILERANFHVLSSRSGSSALKLAQATDGEIQLLLTGVDVVDMSGPDLAEALKDTRPDIHVMLMAGQPQGGLLVLNHGWAYILKAVVAPKLVEMIIHVLSTPSRALKTAEADGHPPDSNEPQTVVATSV